MLDSLGHAARVSHKAAVGVAVIVLLAAYARVFDP
jgi:hypothetical protein